MRAIDSKRNPSLDPFRRTALPRVVIRLTLFVITMPLVVDAAQAAAQPPDARPERPNIVLIFIDDLGYADISPFGATRYATPNLERLAEEGRRFTDFQVSSAVCSASRAALMTGCYHRRIGIDGALGPQAEHGIHDNEVTLAEICRQQGYATACFGKWHLGHHPKFLPLQHGFDVYFGLPYSNDMWPFHPRFAHLPADAAERRRNYPSLPLIEDNQVVDADVTSQDQERLTAWYTERAVKFIEQHHDRPFFLYLPHSMVHVPLHVSSRFRGRSGEGLFGDVMIEVDWSIGEIVATLDRLQLSGKTLVIFTSDNGPWLSYGNHAGSAAPLREGKGTMFEGGSRVPTIMRWPEKIPAGTTCDELASTIDILPTVASLIGAALPDHPIDGLDISLLLFDDSGAESPREVFFSYYANGELQAVRDRRWKLHFPHSYATLAGRPGGRDGLPADYQQASISTALFDLQSDLGETKSLVDQHPDVVQRLTEHAERARRELGDRRTGQTGESVRPAGALTPEDARLSW